MTKYYKAKPRNRRYKFIYNTLNSYLEHITPITLLIIKDVQDMEEPDEIQSLTDKQIYLIENTYVLYNRCITIERKTYKILCWILSGEDQITADRQWEFVRKLPHVKYCCIALCNNLNRSMNKEAILNLKSPRSKGYLREKFFKWDKDIKRLRKLLDDFDDSEHFE